MTLYVPDVDHRCGSGGCPWCGGMQVGAMEEESKNTKDRTRKCWPTLLPVRLWMRWKHGVRHELLTVQCTLCKGFWLTDALIARRAKKAAIKEKEGESA